MTQTQEPAPNPYQAPATVGDAALVLPTDFSGRLRLACVGLKMVSFGIVVLCLSALLTIVSPMFGYQLSPFSGVAGVFMAGGIVIGLLSLAVGPLLCLSVPGEGGARAWIVATVLVGVLTVFAFLISSMIITLLLFVAASVLYLCFVMRLCQIVGRMDLAKRARLIFIGGAFAVTVSIAMIIAINTVRLQWTLLAAHCVFAMLMAISIVFALFTYHVSVALPKASASAAETPAP